MIRNLAVTTTVYITVYSPVINISIKTIMMTKTMTRFNGVSSFLMAHQHIIGYSVPLVTIASFPE